MSSSHSVPSRPKLFVDCTAEGRAVAEILKTALADVAEVTTSCAGIVDASRTFDFAAFVVSGEPERGLLLRLGVFLGAIGHERVVIVCPDSLARDLAPELRDVTVAPYPHPRDGNLAEALGTVGADVRRHVARLATVAGATGPAVRDPASQVARRIRRSLGTAGSVRSGQTLRIVDISSTGALLETYGEIPEHQLLDLELMLENGFRVDVTALVVRIQYPQWGRVGGVGVRFVRFAGDSQASLEEYLEGTLSPGDP